jgi:general secretion pathway protein M
MYGLRLRWNQLAVRERCMLLAAAWVLGLSGVWWWLVAPALTTVRAAPAQHARLDAEIETMQWMQAEAQSLAALGPLSADEARRQLDHAVRQNLGPGAQVSWVGVRATVNLKAVSPEALANWLAQARSNARILPVEMRLARNGAAWDGSVVMTLP